MASESTEKNIFGTRESMRNGYRETLSAREIERLLNAIDLSTAIGLRNATLILLMIATGAKVGELVGKELDSGDTTGGLRKGDFDESAGTVILRRPKDGAERTMAVPLRVRQYLQVLIESRPRANKSDLVFVTGRGTRLQNRYVRRMIHDYGRAAGLDRDVRPSLLRHTYARELLKESGDLFAVKSALGHRHLASSVRYLAEEDKANE